jgi:hypothetical protein
MQFHDAANLPLDARYAVVSSTKTTHSVKPFVRYTALSLAILFLAGASIALIDLLEEGDLLSNPKMKSVLQLLVPGVMFLGLALRGWPRRKPSNGDSNQAKSAKPLR